VKLSWSPGYILFVTGFCYFLCCMGFKLTGKQKGMELDSFKSNVKLSKGTFFYKVNELVQNQF